MMHIGGCAAASACDVSIYLARRFGQSWLYPFDCQALSRRDYVRFSRRMKPYLRPRAGGIDKLSIYIDGFTAYLAEAQAAAENLDGGSEAAAQPTAKKQAAPDQSGGGHGGTGGPMPQHPAPLRLSMSGLSGDSSVTEAWQAVVASIDKELPVPMLLLHHQDTSLKDYEWHWFLLTGYDQGAGEEDGGEEGNSSGEDSIPLGKVQAVTYGEQHWLDFQNLWNTGQAQRGGLILFDWA
jgi:hypothetical protein